MRPAVENSSSSLSDNSSTAPGAHPHGKAVAVINGESVTGEELVLFAEKMMPDFKGEASEEWSEAVDTLINNRLLARKSAIEKVADHPRVRSNVEIVTNPIWTDPYWVAVVRDTVKLTESDFERNAPAFEETVSVRQLVVSDKGRAEALRNKAVENPESFEEMVKSSSEGLAASKGGITAGITRKSTQYSREILDVLFASKKGDFSPVMESPIGYMFFQTLDKTTAVDAKKEWRKTAGADLLRQKEKEVWEKHLGSLIARHKVTFHKKAIADYAKARAAGKDLRPFADKPAMTIDNVVYYVVDLVDPSGKGVLHANEALELIIDKRVRQFVLDREIERLDLKKRFPQEMMIERFRTEHVLARAYVDHRAKGTTITKDAIRKYYEENKGKYLQPRMLDISAIETKSPDRVKMIYKSLAAGEDFGETAARWSDNRKQTKGRVGLIPESRLSPEIKRVAGLKAGEYLKEPVVVPGTAKDPKLYVILRLNGVQKERTLSFREINKDDVRKALTARAREEVIKTILGELRMENQVEITPDYYRFVASAISDKTARRKHEKGH